MEILKKLFIKIFGKIWYLLVNNIDMKKKVVRLTEEDLVRIVKKVVSEQSNNEFKVGNQLGQQSNNRTWTKKTNNPELEKLRNEAYEYAKKINKMDIGARLVFTKNNERLALVVASEESPFYIDGVMDVVKKGNQWGGMSNPYVGTGRPTEKTKSAELEFIPFEKLY